MRVLRGCLSLLALGGLASPRELKRSFNLILSSPRLCSDVVGFSSLEQLTEAVCPSSIRFGEPQQFSGLDTDGVGEREALQQLRDILQHNAHHVKSYLGQGFYGTVTPPVILRNVLENPAWYTAYTPYQAEISQGRMEMLLNYQTMVCELTGMRVANASLLDEGTAAAEALSMCHALHAEGPTAYFVDAAVHPSTLEVVRTRASVLGMAVHVGDPLKFDFNGTPVSGALLQHIGTDGNVRPELRSAVERIKQSKALVVAATDLLACTLLEPPGALGFDAAVGSAQRFGVPMGYGGPHAAFFATRDLQTARRMPGRIMSVSRDRERGQPALRMALQAREQHIRRDKATSNICTAQALLANMAASYAIYHGPKGLRDIATRTHRLAAVLAEGLKRMKGDVELTTPVFFDTVSFRLMKGRTAARVVSSCLESGYNVRALDRKHVTIAVDETTSLDDVFALLDGIRRGVGRDRNLTRRDREKLVEAVKAPLEEGGSAAQLRRTSEFLTHPAFNSYHSETEMLRYLYRLQGKDLSLASAMIPLGSCTMKLNATSEMIPVSWPEISNMHPFAPLRQAEGYLIMINQLSETLASITGFDAVSLQPNSGASGEYAGLCAIRAYHKHIGEPQRDVCLIPTSAHGTNPASAVMAGLKV